MTPKLRKALKTLGSMKLTILCLSFLIVLVVLCTLDQVQLGTYGAVKRDIRSFFIFWTPHPGLKIPIFPGGALIGLILLLNLIISHVTLLRASPKKSGIWLTHLGLIVLVLGEFATGMFSHETHMAIEEGSSINYTEDTRRLELAIVETSLPDYNEVYSVPQSAVSKNGTTIEHPAWPFTLAVQRYYPNAGLSMTQGAGVTNAGIGAKAALEPLAESASDDNPNQPAGIIEITGQNQMLGTWLISTLIQEPQIFNVNGRTFTLALRPARHYLPFTIKLKDFRHDVYPGTDIPKNFSSLIKLLDPDHAQERDVLIYMNHPLRYRGLSFYQSSFGKNDTLSIFQVVKNPGRWLPYISFAMMTIGLIIQFLLTFLNFRSTTAAMSKL